MEEDSNLTSTSGSTSETSQSSEIDFDEINDIQRIGAEEQIVILEKKVNFDRLISIVLFFIKFINIT